FPSVEQIYSSVHYLLLLGREPDWMICKYFLHFRFLPPPSLQRKSSLKISHLNNSLENLFLLINLASSLLLVLILSALRLLHVLIPYFGYSSFLMLHVFFVSLVLNSPSLHLSLSQSYRFHPYLYIE